ncbi:MAG TPA: ATP-binding protein [Pyrinomonadaceae bacterium]
MADLWAFWPSGGNGKRATQGCPCGFWNDPTRDCRCSLLQIQRYVGRISGPLLDRIDIHIDVPAVKFRELAAEDAPETDSSDAIRQRVIAARERQRQRFHGEHIFCNSAMTSRMIRKHCRIDSKSEQLLEQAMTRQGLSARAYDRILKVSRTIADLEGYESIGSTHVSEAVGYRSLDRSYWS